MTRSDAADFDYDAAFSFLAPQETLARRLSKALQPLKTFVFTERQADVAGKNGVDAYSRIFKEKTRLGVILHSAGWGQTAYTGLEEMALQELANRTRYEGVLLVKLDESDTPVWFPHRVELYLDFQRYGFNETVGIIRRRIEERGGVLRPETTLERETRLANERVVKHARKNRLFSEGFRAVKTEMAGAFASIEAGAGAIATATGDLRFESGATDTLCTVCNPVCSMVIWWEEDLNSMDDSCLHVEYRWGPVAPPNRAAQFISSERPLASESFFRLAISDEDTWAWRAPDGRVVSSEAFADMVLGWLCARVRSGPPKSVGRRHQPGTGWAQDYKRW
jgi:hypothetical protein